MNSVIPRGPELSDDSLWATLPTYLRQAFTPIREWLQSAEVVEIMCNRPGEVWVESIKWPQMRRFDVPALSVQAIEHMAHQVASHTKQSVNATTPLLSAAMPHGERFQGVLAPAAAMGGAFSIRKQVISNFSLDDYVRVGALDDVRIMGPRQIDEEDITDLDIEMNDLLQDRSALGIKRFLEFSVSNQVTKIISGGTSSGKTTFLNALMKEVPETERLILIEDTSELKPLQPNVMSLLASKGDQGQSNATIQSLLEAALRLRPDRIFLGEIRGAEAYSFLQAVNTGHPGSMSTLHANNPREAFERLAMATLQAGLGLTKAEIIDYVRLVVPVIVQVRRMPTRGVAAIYFNRYRGKKA